MVQSSLPPDRRLLGTWKSDRHLTLKHFRPKDGCSPQKPSENFVPFLGTSSCAGPPNAISPNWMGYGEPKPMRWSLWMIPASLFDWVPYYSRPTLWKNQSYFTSTLIKIITGSAPAGICTNGSSGWKRNHQSYQKLQLKPGRNAPQAKISRPMPLNPNHFC